MHKALPCLLLAVILLLLRPRHHDPQPPLTRNVQSSKHFIPADHSYNTSFYPLHSFPNVGRSTIELPIPFHWPSPDPPAHRRMILSRALLTSPLMQRILVAPSSRVVYCPIPGSISFHELLTVANKGRLHTLSEYSIRDRERLLLRPDVFRFVFVVHPFARLLASFYRGTRGTGGINGPTYRQFMGKVRGRELNDGEHELQMISMQFLLSFLARNNSRHEEFQSQTRLCGFGSVQYSFVGRVESLSRDIQMLNKYAQIPTVSIRADPFVREASKDIKNVFRKQRLRAKAIRLYADDLRDFHYSDEFD